MHAVIDMTMLQIDISDDTIDDPTEHDRVRARMTDPTFPTPWRGGPPRRVAGDSGRRAEPGAPFVIEHREALINVEAV